MKIYREEIRKEKVVASTICNICGMPSERHCTDNVSQHWTCELKIIWINHGPYPGQDDGVSTYDICEKCLIAKIKPLFNLPANMTIHDFDSHTTIVTP